MSNTACAQERFLRDIAEHKMEIIKDDGVYRHVRFKRPGTTSMHFDLVTWPGKLCYTGDMGDYLFERLRDMFDFFRGEEINPHYWQEKLLAVDRDSPADKFNYDYAIECVKGYSAFEDLEEDERAELLNNLSDIDSSDERGFYRAVIEFKVDDDYPFQDFFEVDAKLYTFRYLWACYAIVWGIQQYDAFKAAEIQQ